MAGDVRRERLGRRTSSGPRRQHVIISAQIWLRSAREDFRTMGDLAAIDPNVQRKTALKALEPGGNQIEENRVDKLSKFSCIATFGR